MPYSTSTIHKQYTPLSLSVSVTASGVSAAQMYNQFEDTFSPERTKSSPTIFTPVVVATVNDSDPSWTDGNKNALLTEVKWLANGEDISDKSSSVYKYFHDSTGAALYTIVSASDATNATLKLWMNQEATLRFTMQMSAKLSDTRAYKNSGVTSLIRTYPILTDGIDVYVNTRGDSELDFSVVHDVSIRYNPCFDQLRLYDYLVSIGKLTPSDTERKKYCDGLQYDLTLPIIVTYGHVKYTPGSDIRFRVLDHLNNHTEFVVGTTQWLKEVTSSYIRVDQRYIGDERIVADVVLEKQKPDGTWVLCSQEQLTFTRWLPAIMAVPTNSCDIDLTAKTRTDHALVTFNGKKVDYPLAYLSLKWYARSSESDEWTYQGEGEDIEIDQKALGISTTGRDALYIMLEYEFSEGYAILVNSDGAAIVDANGNNITILY